MRFGGLLLSSALITSLSIVIVAGSPALAQQTQAITFDVAQQDLPSALQDFSRQANIQILYPSEQIAKRTAPAIHGSMSAKEALAKLLSGSNLHVVKFDGNVVVLAVKEKKSEVQAAPAQSLAGAEVETIVINGYLESLDKARQAKRESAVISEAVVSDDIAKFPELNLAEALQRLPGVTINREAGEGRRLTLRGLGPDYTRVQLNGMEVLGNVDSAQDSRTQRSRDRAFDYNMFASELFAKAQVDKSYTPSQSEGGMAGTIGLFTAKPLDYAPGFKGALSVKAGTNTYTKDFQPRVVGELGYNWGNTFGVLVTLAVSKRKTEEQGYNTYEGTTESSDAYSTFFSTGGDISKLSATDQAKFKSGSLWWQEGNRLSVWNAKQSRIGLTTAVQWRPVDEFEVTVDFLKSRFHMARDEYHLATRASDLDEQIWNTGYTEYGRTIKASTINALKYDSANFATYTDVDNAVFGSEHRKEINTNNFEQSVVTYSWTPTSHLKIDGHLGLQDSTYKTPMDDKIYLQAFGGIVASYSADGDRGFNSYNWNTADAKNWWIRDVNLNQYSQYTTFQDAAVNGTYSFSDALSVKSGYLYRRYKNGGTEGYSSNNHASDFAGYNYATSISSVFRDYNGASWVTADYDKVFSKYGLSNDGVARTTKNSFTVIEATDAGYLEVNGKTEIGGFEVTGSGGFRAYQTDVTNSGYVKNSAGALSLQTINSSYSDILPAFNVAVSLSDDVKLRAAFAENINRPSLNSMKMTGSVTVNNGKYYVSNGNPYLKPYTSDNYDLSLEYYMGKTGMLALGVFHKDIDNLSASMTAKNVPFSTTGLSTALAAGLTDSTNVTEYSYQVNMGKAGISGVELAAQSDFFFLPAPFNHLGAVANLTLITSHTLYGGTSQPLTGMSNESANFTLYYEADNWGVRASANYRSGYLRKNYDGSDPTSSDGFKATTYVDAAAFYKLSDNLQLTFDAINLTNQREVQWNTPWKELHNETSSGTTALVGVNYQF